MNIQKRLEQTEGCVLFRLLTQQVHDEVIALLKANDIPYTYYLDAVAFDDKALALKLRLKYKEDELYIEPNPY